MSDPAVVHFDVLTKDNYYTWRMQAEALLVVSDLWKYVEEDKESISKGVDRWGLWIKQDKIAKSKLILHISSSLLPLVEKCTTSREVWLKLANVYGNEVEKHGDAIEDSDTDYEDAIENSDTDYEDAIENLDTDDEYAIINAIECSVDDFFETINDLSEKNIMEDKKSLSTVFTDHSFSRLNINSVKKLPDKQIIVDTISDFIDVIGELSKIEIDERKKKLRNKLIDSLLVKFNINPHQNDNDDTKSKADTAQTRDNGTAGGGKNENDEVSSRLMSSNSHDIAENQREMIHKDKITIINEPISYDWFSEMSKLQQQLDNQRNLCKLHGQEELENSKESPKRTYKYGVCREEGHNRSTCPLNKPAAASAPQYANAITTHKTPEKLYKSLLFDKEGHNRTTLPLNKPAAAVSAPQYANATTTHKAPEKSYKSGLFGDEGHNRTALPLNKPAAAVSAPQYANATTTHKAPEKSYKSGLFGDEGHNRTTLPLNKPAAAVSAPQYANATTTHKAPEKSYKSGLFGDEGHNRTTLPLNKPAAVFAPQYANATTTHKAPEKSYKCEGCGNEGHNIKSCPLMKSKPAVISTPTKSFANSVTSIASTKAAYRRCNCGGEGHNGRTCGRRQTSSSSYYTASLYSYSSAAPSYGGGHGHTYATTVVVQGTIKERAQGSSHQKTSTYSYQQCNYET